MTKTDRTQIARATLYGDVRVLAATVCAIYRSGTVRTQNECREVIKTSDLEHAIVWVNGCPVARDTVLRKEHRA